MVVGVGPRAGKGWMPSSWRVGRGLVSRGWSPGAGICRWRGAERGRWRPCLPGFRAWGHRWAGPLQVFGQDGSIIPICVAAGALVGVGGAGRAQRGCGTPACQADTSWDRASVSHLPQLSGGGPPGVVDAGSPAHGRPCSIMTLEDKSDDPSHGQGRSVLQTGSRFRAFAECLMPLGMDGPPWGHLPGEVEPDAQPCGCSTTCWRVSG